MQKKVFIFEWNLDTSAKESKSLTMTRNPMLVVGQIVFDTIVKNVVAFVNVRIGKYDNNKRVSI